MSLVVITYCILFFFVFYDLFPYGAKVAEKFKFWLHARRSRSGETAEEAEASYRARQRWQRARTLVLRRVRGNARLLFRKEVAVKLTAAVHDFELYPPSAEPRGGAAPADREMSLQEVLEMLQSLSVNIKTPLEKHDDPGAGGFWVMNEAEEILFSSHDASTASTSSSRRVVHRKERSRANAELLASPSLNAEGRRGDGGANQEVTHATNGSEEEEEEEEEEKEDHQRKLVGTLASEVTMVARNFARSFSKTLELLVRAKDGDEDDAFKLRQLEEILRERRHRGTLKPPALGEGVLSDDVAAFMTDAIPLRISRALFIKVLMLLEYLRLKEAGDADPFWATARGRAMLLEHNLLRRFDPIPPKEEEEDVNISSNTSRRSRGVVDDANGGGSGSGGSGDGGEHLAACLSSEDVAAHLSAVRYYEVLVAHLKQREGEPDLDMTAASKDPLTQLGSQVSSYSAVFSIN